MAPTRKLKTYRRSNTSSVNSSMDAMNVLFNIQKPKRIINKKRKKREDLIKGLLSRPKYASVLATDSFQISMDDTFDKLSKKPCNGPARDFIHDSTANKSQSFNKPFSSTEIIIHSPVLTRQRKNFLDSYDKLFKKPCSKASASNFVHNSTVDNSKSLNNSEVGRFITTEITIHSPILTNRKKKNFLESSNSMQIFETTDSYEKSHLKRLKEPSDEHIDESMEILRKEDKQFSSLSYINVPNKLDSLKMPNSFNCSKLGVSIDTFSKSLQQKLYNKCSTPMSKFERSNLINGTMSPGKIDSLVGEESMTSNMSHIQSKNLDKTEDTSISDYMESKSCDNDTPQKDKSFITLRQRKILKRKGQTLKKINLRKHKPVISDSETQGLSLSNDSEMQGSSLTNNLESFSDIEQQGHVLTTNLESLNKFENKIASYISKRRDSYTDFQSFEQLLSPVNFVTKRKAVSKDIFYESEEEEFLETNEQPVVLKELFVHLERLSSSTTSLESEFEHFYSSNISKELDNTNLRSKSLEIFEQFYSSNISKELNGNKTDKSLESFEQFYASNFINSQNSDQSLRKNSSDPNKKDAISLSVDEFEKFCFSHHSISDSKDVDRTKGIPEKTKNNVTREDSVNTDLNYNKDNIIKDLRVKIIKETLRGQSKKNNNLEVSNDLTTDNIEKENIKIKKSMNNDEIIDLTNETVEIKQCEVNVNKNPVLRIVLTRHDISNLMIEATNDSDNTNNKSTVDMTLKCPQVDKQKLTVDITKNENFEMFYNDKYDIYDFPLPTVEVKVVEKNDSNLTGNGKSLDVIESSYIESPLLYLRKSKKNHTKNSSKSKTGNKAIKNGKVQNLNDSPHTPTSENQILVNNNITPIFKMPKSPFILKGGKNWKRSMSIYRNSICSSPKEDNRSSLLGKTCPKGKPSRLSNLKSRKSSVCVIPMSSIVDLEDSTQNSIVEYALNNSYVPDQIIEGSLEDSFRCLSLNHVNTHNNKSRLDQVPITAKDVVLRKCGQTEPLEFSKCFPDSILSHCHKIGEGVFGEVFLFRNPKGGTSVMKIVPVEGDLIVNGERQKKFEEVLSEIIITMELSNLRNNKRNGIPSFTEVQKIQCVQGKYPEKLVFLWDEYDETKGSENDCPDMFRHDQLYIVFQMAYGGKDLEAFEFNNASQAYSMFQQVAIGLAVAEEELRFEHRDLHWGNVLVSTVEPNKIASFTLNSCTYDLPTMGVEVAIIDFTLSRIEHNGVVIFNDLSMDPDLFVAEGDYQFEIYRLMQDKNRNNWKDFDSYTNLLWLHYILDKAVMALRYKNIKSKRHRDYIRKLKMLKEDVLCYHNVKEFVFAKLLEI